MVAKVRKVLVVGGGRPGGIEVPLVKSQDIGILGVGEGTSPTIRKTLSRIGIDEAELVRRCGATFKQGAKFIHWRHSPGAPGHDHYLHAFQETDERAGPELLPYWLLGVAGEENWDEVNTPQKKAADAHRAPKLPSHPDYVGPLHYAFHFDAVTLAELLSEQGIANGVAHRVDTVQEVLLGEDGAIAGVRGAEHGVITADLYIDCTGFRAELI